MCKLCPWLQVECPPNTPQLCNGHSCPVKMSFSFVCERSVDTHVFCQLFATHACPSASYSVGSPCQDTIYACRSTSTDPSTCSFTCAYRCSFLESIRTGFVPASLSFSLSACVSILVVLARWYHVSGWPAALLANPGSLFAVGLQEVPTQYPLSASGQAH